MPKLFVVFKKATESSMESVVNWFAGPMIHVDIVPGDDMMSYTSYMFETFSANPVGGYRADTHTCLVLDVTQTEHDAALKVLTGFVESGLEYNYNDAIRSVLPGPTTFNAADIESTEDVQSLYCSQAVAMVLRGCLMDHKPIADALASMNSRFTTPNMLYDALVPFASESDELLCA
jgi:hypothetical protein